jgi:hypothetical protein
MIPSTINKNAIVDASPSKKNVSIPDNIGANEYAIVINTITITITKTTTTSTTTITSNTIIVTITITTTIVSINNS